MTLSFRHYVSTLVAVAIGLAAIVTLNVLPYGGNITSLFNMDNTLAAQHVPPHGFIVLGVPGYDGEMYYQVARNIPKIFSLSRWPDLVNTSPGPYAYQRFLLPLTAYVFAFGITGLLPFSFLFIQIVSLLGVAYLTLRITKKPLYALVLALSPSAMVGLHFSLAEPLTLLLLVGFFALYLPDEDLDWTAVILLCLLVWAREVNILFVGFLILYSLYKKRPMDVLALFIPVLSFLVLHGLLFLIFHQVPFLLSAAAKDFPGHAAWQVLIGERGYSTYTLSAIAIFLGFVIPGFLWAIWNAIMARRIALLEIGTILFFLVMLTMPDYIWGSVTSIGRVITPIYPLFLLYCAKRDDTIARSLASLVLLIGLVTAVGLALMPHPFTVA